MKSLFLFALLLLWVTCQKQQRQYGLPNCFTNGSPLRIALQVLDSNGTIINKTTLPIVYANDGHVYEVDFNVSQGVQNYSLIAELYDEQTGKLYDTVIGQLTRYAKVKNSHSAGMAMQFGISNEGSGEQSAYDLHIASKYSLLLIFVEQILHSRHEYFHILNFKKSPQCYIPLLDKSQMHIPYKTYRPLSTVNGSHTVTVQVQVYPITNYVMFMGLTNKEMIQRANPMMADVYDDATIDMIKEVIFGNSFYLVVAYFTLSLLETFMQIFAFKEEIKVWKQIEKNAGLSIKSLYQNLACEIIVCLYLYDSQASNFYIFFQVVSLIMTLWKLSRAVEVSFSSNNRFFIKIQYKQWYHKKVQSSDNQAMHYTTYLVLGLYSIFMVYKLYTPFMTQWAYYEKNKAIIYPSLKSIYSFILQSSVGFIFIFGFVMMTPQLYINYKLKSVDHLPWKTLIYRFIATIIDDIFVFMVDVPTMTRAFSFRDDIIFICYLVQRRMYKVDKNRLAVSTGSINLSEQKQLLGGQKTALLPQETTVGKKNQ